MFRKSMMIALVLGVAFSFAGASRADDTAAIKGKVIFKGDPAKFKRDSIDTTKDPNCKANAPKGIGTEEVIVDKENTPPTLRNVIVTVKEGLGDRKFEAKKDAVTIDQVGCQYKPHVVAMQKGQPLKVRNGDDTNHNIHFQPKVNQELNFSQPKKDMEKDVELVTEVPFKVKCDVHPWMGAWVAVYDHPFFNVTGKEGTFEIKNLPPGKYVIEAWHEKFGTQTATVEVKSGEAKEQDFTFEPK